jgi:hypothetical protein
MQDTCLANVISQIRWGYSSSLADCLMEARV